MEIKINKWNLITLEKFYTAKETINKMTRQLSEWEKIIANEATDKGLINLQNIQAAHTAQYLKNKQLIPKMGRRSKQTFLQRNEYMK